MLKFLQILQILGNLAFSLLNKLFLRIEKIKFLIWAKKQAIKVPCQESLNIWKNSILFSEEIARKNPLDNLPYILDKDRQEYWWRFPNNYPFIYGLSKFLKPTSYLEIGTRYGYSLVSIYLGAKESLNFITSIDLEEYENKSQNYARENLLSVGYKGKYELSIGSSHDSKIKQKVQGKLYDLVCVDGDHSYEGTLDDIIFYWNNVRPGKFMIIDDVLWQVFSNGKRVLRAVKDSLNKLNDIEFFEVIGAGIHTKHKPEYGIQLSEFNDRRTSLISFYRGLALIKKRIN